MAARPMPPDGPERWRRYEEADRETREAHPADYWFHSFDGAPNSGGAKVSEEEFRANTDKHSLDILNSMSAVSTRGTDC
jgi:hypothetical protein